MLPLAALCCLSFQAPAAAEFWEESAPLSFGDRTVAATLLDVDQDGYPEYFRLGLTPVTTVGTLGITRGSAYGPVGPELCSFPTYFPVSIGAEDLDGDGRRDLFVVHNRIVAVNPPVTQAVPTLTLYFRNALPLAACASAFATTRCDLSFGAEFAAFGDFDQDGVLDLASVGRAHRLYYQKGLGFAGGVPRYSGQFFDVSLAAAQTVGAPFAFQFGFASGLAVADFDGDGTDDLAVSATSGLGGGVHVFFQRPAGFVYQGLIFTSPSGGVLGVTSLERGDFDGDGWTDLAATVAGSILHVLTNSGPTSPAFPPNQALGMLDLPSNGVGLGASELRAADFDLDGTLDLACSDSATNGVAVAYNRNALAPGWFDASEVTSLPGQGTLLRDLSAADVDDDGDVDIAASYMISQSTELHFGELLANSRKARGTLVLRGTRVGGALASSFVPDGDELVQASTAVASPGGAYELASSWRFRADAGVGARLRIRLQDRTAGQNVSGALGLRSVLTGQIVWVAQYAAGTQLQDQTFDVPGASPFVSSLGKVELVWRHASTSGSFQSSLDQASLESRP